MAQYEYSGITEQAKAAFKRLADARVLAAQKHWRGAMYLAGYAVECRLKVRLMEMYRAKSLADLKTLLASKSQEPVEVATHSIEFLFGFTGAAARLVDHGNPVVLQAYRRCNAWKTSWRYSPSDGSKEECDIFLEAVDTFSRFIQSSV